MPRSDVIGEDPRFMMRALRLARKAGRAVAPNPRVGCVIVRDGNIIAEGWHHRYGMPHAERDALAMAGDGARGATMYVTLEPCNHTGKTPPCTDAIIDAGIAKVVVGSIDPNPIVSGRGVAKLRDSGIHVVTGMLADACAEENAEFEVNVTRHRPFVIAKLAQSLDGFAAPLRGPSRWITSHESRREGHRLRAAVDAVLVGAGTVRKDNPQLTVRDAPGADPIRIILTGSGTFPSGTSLLRPPLDAGTWIVSTASARRAHPSSFARLERTSATLITVPGRSTAACAPMLRMLYDRGIRALLIEGGPSVVSWFSEAGLVDRLDMFIAPIVLGRGIGSFSRVRGRTLQTALHWTLVRSKASGTDIHMQFRPTSQET